MTTSAAAELGTAEGQRLLYEAEYGDMVRLARLVTGSQEMAEDAVHDAFITVFLRGGSIERPGAYLRRVVLNNCFGTQRRRRIERLKLQAIADREVDQVTLPPELDETWRALHKLTSRQRTALVLRYYDDLTVEDIADAMAERPGTVKSLLHRGRKRLEREMAR